MGSAMRLRERSTFILGNLFSLLRDWSAVRIRLMIKYLRSKIFNKEYQISDSDFITIVLVFFLNRDVA